MITFGSITWDNFEEILKLQIKPEQEDFIVPNLYCLAQSYVSLLNDTSPRISYAIYNDDALIGFFMVGYETEEKSKLHMLSYAIYSFMLDVNFQGNGYGKDAFSKVVEYLLSSPQGKVDALTIAYSPKNLVAKHLYELFGFIETNVYDDTDVIAFLKL